MKPLHMNPAEAIYAHRDLGSRHSIGMHFGTFRMAGEGIDQPVQALEEACRANGIPAGRFRTTPTIESSSSHRRLSLAP